MFVIASTFDAEILYGNASLGEDEYAVDCDVDVHRPANFRQERARMRVDGSSLRSDWTGARRGWNWQRQHTTVAYQLQAEWAW